MAIWVSRIKGYVLLQKYLLFSMTTAKFIQFCRIFFEGLRNNKSIIYFHLLYSLKVFQTFLIRNNYLIKNSHKKTSNIFSMLTLTSFTSIQRYIIKGKLFASIIGEQSVGIFCKVIALWKGNLLNNMIR